MMLGRLQVPPTARRGEAFEIRVLIQHPMETGFRRDLNGNSIPINIVDKLVCRYAGAEVFSVEPGSGVAANPYFAFYAVAEASGEIVVEWSDDRGERGRVAAKIAVA
jgi:sulfur-oxidizing protein SoxZ